MRGVEGGPVVLDPLLTPFGPGALLPLAVSPGPLPVGAALPATSVSCPGWLPGCLGTP